MIRLVTTFVTHHHLPNSPTTPPLHIPHQSLTAQILFCHHPVSLLSLLPYRIKLLQETRGGPWQEEVTAGCCSLQAAPDPDHAALLGPAKEPVLASCVRSFMSWMAEKAERGTSALLESLPSLSKEDFHIVMIGLDGAGKTTALYRLKFDHYMNTVPTVGFNCERVKGTVGRSRGLTFLIWDVGGQER